MITAYGTSDNAQVAFKFGGRGFFTKPFNAIEIIDEVARHLNGEYTIKLDGFGLRRGRRN